MVSHCDEVRCGEYLYVNDIIILSTATVRCADERAPHSGRTIEPTAAAGRARRWQVVVGRVERARRKKNKIIIITKTQKTGGGADECASGVCARGARESELQEDRVQAAAATMGRVHPARISFCTLCRGGVLQETDRCRLHRRTI